jgi:hypothetical protein
VSSPFNRVLSLLQILEIRVAQSTANCLQVEANVIAFVRIKHVEQITAKQLTVGTADAMPSPDLAEGMDAGVATAVDCLELVGQLGTLAQQVFDLRHLGW